MSNMNNTIDYFLLISRLLSYKCKETIGERTLVSISQKEYILM